jgi:3-phosphoglycerate kinase
MRARDADVPIPVDVVTAKTFAADAPATIKAPTEVADGDLILDIGIEKDVGYICTGGGAFLEVLEGKTLPALQILAQCARP